MLNVKVLLQDVVMRSPALLARPPALLTSICFMASDLVFKPLVNKPSVLVVASDKALAMAVIAATSLLLLLSTSSGANSSARNTSLTASDTTEKVWTIAARGFTANRCRKQQQVKRNSWLSLIKCTLTWDGIVHDHYLWFCSWSNRLIVLQQVCLLVSLREQRLRHVRDKHSIGSMVMQRRMTRIVG